ARNTTEAAMRSATVTTEAISPAREYMLLLVLATLWGASYTFIRLGVATIPPVTLIAARTLIGGTLLFAVLVRRGIAVPHRMAMWRQFSFRALPTGGVRFTLIAWAKKPAAAGLPPILCPPPPIFPFPTPCAAPRHEPATLTKLLG